MIPLQTKPTLANDISIAHSGNSPEKRTEINTFITNNIQLADVSH